jgi:hypothetical protein
MIVGGDDGVEVIPMSGAGRTAAAVLCGCVLMIQKSRNLKVLRVSHEAIAYKVRYSPL